MGRRRELLQIQIGSNEEAEHFQTLDDLYLFAERHQIEVDRFSMRRSESVSMPLPSGRYGIAIDPERLKGEVDEKMKLAHELGHCATGSFYNKYAACDVRRKHENRADKWAIQHFLSENDLDEAVADGSTDIWSLAEHFEVSVDFMKKAVCWYTYGNLAVEEYMNF